MDSTVHCSLSNSVNAVSGTARVLRGSAMTRPEDDGTGNAARGARAGSVRFGRVPLWLFESGAPLQAIAAYAWLHGRYGHHGQVTPSYGTLAKELKVSRGS